MASKIDPTQINAAYPVANINQSTQGFRDNFSSIQKNFSTAKSEIGVLQSTSITMTGDLQNTGTAPVLNQPVSLSIPLNVSLVSLFASNQNVDTSANNISFTVDTKGRVSTITSTPKTAYTGNKNPGFNITKNPEDGTYPDATGIKSIAAPVFTIDNYGNITQTEYSTLDGFGLLGYGMTKGSLVAGNNLNLSSYTDPAPMDGKQYFLVTDNTKETGLSWTTLDIPTNTILDIKGGNYISITGTQSEPVINLDMSSLTENDAVTSNTKLISKNDDNSINYIQVSDIVSLISDESYLKTVEQDPNPKLGGDLDLNSHNISSTGDISIGTTSSNVGLKLSNNSNSLVLSSNLTATISGNIVLNSGSLNVTNKSTKITSGNSVISVADSSGDITISNDKNILLSTTTSSGLIKLNGIAYPKAPPTSNKSYLTVDTDGTTSYMTLSDALDVSASNGISATTNSNGTTDLVLDYSNMTPTTSFTKGKSSVVVLDTTYLKTQLVPLSTIIDNDLQACFVSPTGDDINGDGGYFNPYQTIQKALNGDVTNIILFPGTYSEQLTISKSNVRIYSYKEFSSTIVGSITISTSITGLYLSGIVFQYSGTTAPYILNTFTTTNDIIFDRCIFKQNQSDTLMKLTGNLTQYVYFLQCSITGIIENNFSSGTVIVDEQYDTDINLRIVNSSTSSTIVRNITKLLSVDHQSGSVILENIDIVYDIYNIVTNTDDSGNVTSITSESIKSSSNNETDLLYINDCSLFNYNNGYYSNINKTGTCPYVLQDVNRDVTIDVLTGTPRIYDKLTTTFDFIKDVSISSGTYTLDMLSNSYKLTTSTNTVITVPTPTTGYSGSNLDYSLRINLNGTGTGTFSFDSTVYTTKGYDLTFDGTNGQNIIFELEWSEDKKSWYCVNRYNLDLSESNSFIPTKSILEYGVVNDPSGNYIDANTTAYLNAFKSTAGKYRLYHPKGIDVVMRTFATGALDGVYWNFDGNWKMADGEQSNIFDITGWTNFVIEGSGTFDGNKSGQTGATYPKALGGIVSNISGTQNSSTQTNSAGASITVPPMPVASSSPTTTSNGKIVGIEIINCWNWPINLAYIENVKVEYCSLHDSSGSPQFFESANDCQFNFNNVYSIKDGGFVFYRGNNRCSAIGNNIHDCYDGIGVYAEYDELPADSFINITNNIIWNNRDSGTGVTTGLTPPDLMQQRILIANNIYNNNNTGGRSGGGSIGIAGAQGVIIRDNIIFGDGNGTTSTNTSYGISVDSTSQFIDIEGNQIADIGCSTGLGVGIYIKSSTNIRVSNNSGYNTQGSSGVMKALIGGLFGSGCYMTGNKALSPLNGDWDQITKASDTAYEQRDNSNAYKISGTSNLDTVVVSKKITVPNVDDFTSQEAIPAVQADQRYSKVRTRIRQNPTSNGQSAFSVNYVSADLVDVYLNGMMLDFDNSYTCSNGTTITLSSSIASNITTSDVLIFILN